MSNTKISLSETTGVILAGGLGSRLRLSVTDRPKVMAEVKGRPFISYLLDHLYKTGMTKIVISTGYMADFIERTLGNSYKGLEIIYSRENKPLGTGGALKLGHSHIHSQHVLVMNGDTFVDFDFKEFFSEHLRAKSLVSLLLCEVEDVRPYGSVKVDGHGCITTFVEKGHDLQTGWVNAGSYLISSNTLEKLPSPKKFSIESDFFPKLIGRREMIGFCSNKRLHDIGTPDSYRYFLSKMTDKKNN